MKASAQTEAAVRAMLDRFLRAYEGRDMQALLSNVVQNDHMVLFGTGKDERRVGVAEFKFQAERDWSQTEALAFSIDWLHISESGSAAWIAGEGAGSGRAGGQDFQFPFRLTAVLEKQGEQWLLAQSHFSLPAAGQEEGDSKPV